MSDRQKAGRKARRHGAAAEREYAQFLRDAGYTVHRVRGAPYDLIAYKDDEWLLPQVKSYVLSDKELKRAEAELGIRVPASAVKEVAQKNRKKGKTEKALDDRRVWITELV